jgi:hypothetical protein
MVLQVAHKPSGPVGRIEMPSHRVPQVGWRWRKVPQVHMTRKLSGPIGWMQKGPTGTHRMEKGPSRDFYDELQASSDTQPLGPIGLMEMENGPIGTRDT